MKYLLLLLTMILVNCASSGGIGVVFNQQGIVRQVFRNSPAEKAGILVDDIILNKYKLRGPIGSICLVKYQRADVYYEKLIKRVDLKNLSHW